MVSKIETRGEILGKETMIDKSKLLKVKVEDVYPISTTVKCDTRQELIALAQRVARYLRKETMTDGAQAGL